MVVLDAAKACASSPPDLATCPADFVVRTLLSWLYTCSLPSSTLHRLAKVLIVVQQAACLICISVPLLMRPRVAVMLYS